MIRLLSLCLCLSTLSAAAADFPCGAKPSPRHKILAAPRHKPTAPPPPQFARVPAQNSMFGNDQFGDCVTAEEAFCKACDGVPLSTQVVVDWARQHGFLDGADLISVMEAMASDGFPGTSPQHFDDGPFATVNYGDEPTLKSAIALGNVKIAIDHTALPSGAGNEQGWYAIGGGSYPNTDHCVSICGYGAADYLYSRLNVATPPALAGTSGYLVDTWGTIGFVDHAWLMSAMAGAGEAYVRNPTTVVAPPSPQPTPAPRRPTLAELVDALKRFLHRRALADGTIPPGTPVEAVNWQGLIKFVDEVLPLIEALLPLFVGDETAALERSPFALCAHQTDRRECGPSGCRRVFKTPRTETDENETVTPPERKSAVRRRTAAPPAARLFAPRRFRAGRFGRSVYRF